MNTTLHTAVQGDVCHDYIYALHTYIPVLTYTYFCVFKYVKNAGDHAHSNTQRDRSHEYIYMYMYKCIWGGYGQ